MSRYNTNRYNINKNTTLNNKRVQNNTNNVTRQINNTTQNTTQNTPQNRPQNRPTVSNRPNRPPLNTRPAQNHQNNKYPSSELRSWMTIHKKAKYATTPELRNEFESYIKYLGQHYPCGKCRPHIKSYLRSYPVPTVPTNNPDNDIIYRWAWNFHNTVNQRLKKATYSWESAKKLYNDL